MHFKAQRSALVKEQIWDIMHYGRGHAGSVFNVVLVILILFSCAILPVEFFRNDLVVFKAIEVAITIIFTMEYALRIYAAPNKKRYITSFYGIVDLVSVAPFYLGLFATQYVRMLRLVRLIRLLKLSRVEASASTQKDSAKEVGLLAGEKVDFVVSRHPLILIIGSSTCRAFNCARHLCAVRSINSININYGNSDCLLMYLLVEGTS